MKIAIAGAGRIGAMHAEILAAHTEVTEVVVADVAIDRATQVAMKVGGVAVGTVDELFKRGLNGVVIATATSSHVQIIDAALEAQVPVFCEKPVAPDVEQTMNVLEKVTASGIPVQVGFQRRFDDGYIAARRALQGGEIGELRRVHMITADPAPPAASFIETSGGIFRDLHIHDFDILRWVTGREVAEVYALGANRGEDFFRAAEDVDESVILLTLDDGTLVTMHGSRYNGAGYDIRMEVAGTRSTYVVGLADRSPLRSAEPGVAFPVGDPWFFFWDRFRSAYAAEVHAFVDVAAGRRENPCSVIDALQASHIAEAADLSRRERRAVKLEEVYSDRGAR